MRYTTQLLLTISLLLFAACSSTKNTAVKTVFPFTYQNGDYTITSIVMPEGDGVNMLAYYEGDNLVFRARDNDMDGLMDYVINGEASIAEINEIYQYGIREAIRLDKFKTLKSLRKYEFAANGNRFTIHTYGFLNDEVYNEFTIADTTGITLAIWLDIQANGELTDIKFGEFPWDQAQKFYTLVLNSGLQADRITAANDKMVVKRTKP
ncbi:hypothetical protein [Gracilimonas mengyeensis]|uniref:Uncharacterized protein n=1 Tax=Gracilimonas mengyeensis TaxID=1302730 RepID=A0A521F8H8_9BACT|nr:hypothetical protein [Gracilimonas mengyeensis]SMO92509.1 hypothetical protein SAMN06265219_1161 [Gracilimonas mengyeensis]